MSRATERDAWRMLEAAAAARERRRAIDEAPVHGTPHADTVEWVIFGIFFGTVGIWCFVLRALAELLQ